MKVQFADVARPLARLVGHSLSAAIGFCALAVISVVPIEMLKFLSLIGISERVQPLLILEQTLLFADVCLFAVIFLSGVAVFAAETVGTARRRIRHIVRENDREQ